MERIKISKLLIPLEAKSKYTEEYSYNNGGEYIVIDGSTQNFDYKLKIDTYDYDCLAISVSTVGFYAGHVSYYQGKFSVGNNVACFKLSEEALKRGVDVKYLVFKFFGVTKTITSGESGGYAALNVNKFLNSYIQLDDVEQQKKIIEFMSKREEISKLENKITNVIGAFEKYQLGAVEGTETPINKIVELIGGSGYLTEEFLYNNSDNLDDLLPVYSGAVEFNGRYVNRNKARKIFTDSLKITRKGLAGYIMFIKGDFTINDDAYVVKIKEEYKDKVNLNFLHFYFLSIISKAISSEDGNGTFNKTKFLSFNIKLPKKEIQDKFGKVFEKYIKLSVANNRMCELRIKMNREMYSYNY